MGATTFSYSLYFLHVVMGIFFLSGKSEIILKTDICGNHVKEIFPHRGQEEFLSTIS